MSFHTMTRLLMKIRGTGRKRRAEWISLVGERVVSTKYVRERDLNQRGERERIERETGYGG